MHKLGLFEGVISLALIASACEVGDAGNGQGDVAGADGSAVGVDAGAGDSGSGPDDGGALVVDAAPEDYDWMDHIDFYEIDSVGRSCDEGRYGVHYCDVMDHTINPYLASDLLTNVHETQHFMLHENDGATPAADKFIYWRQGKGAFFLEPDITTGDVVEFIADEYLVYDTYIAQRLSQPLGENIVDEWCAYLTEEIVAIQMAHIEGETSGVDGLVVAGVEFLYYNAAALHALTVKEPSYLEDNPQSLAIFAMMAEGTKEWTIDQGVDVDLFTSWANDRAKQQLADFRTSPANEPIRQTLRELYGEAWTLRVLGF